MSVHKTAEGTYRVRYYDSAGKQRSKNFKKKKDAGAFDREMADRKHGYRSPDQVDMSKRNMTMGEFFALYVKRYNEKNATLRQVNARWLPAKKNPTIAHLGKKWESYSLAECNTRELVEEWHAEMRNAGCSSAMMYRAHDLLAALVNKAVKWGYLTRSNIEGMAPDYVPARSSGPWLPASIEALREDFLRRVANPPAGARGGGVNGAAVEPYRWGRMRDATIVSVLGYVAVRPGEAMAFQWDDLLDGNKIIHALEIEEHRPTHKDDDERGTKTGVGATRTVLFPPWVRADLHLFWLRSGVPRSGWVFPRERGGEPFTFPGDWSNWTRSHWTPTVKRVGLDARPPKHLRHSCVSTWLRAGMPLDVAARRAGHTISTCEKTYRHEIELRTLSDFEALDLPALVAEARGAFPGMSDFFPMAVNG